MVNTRNTTAPPPSRVASLTNEREEEERLKVPAIPKYEGKTQAEYREFIKSCVKTFDMKRTIYRDELRQIQCAIVHLNCDPDVVWF